MHPVAHFEIHASDPERASTFYTNVFNWRVTKWDGPFDYWLVSARNGGNGIDGAIVQRLGDAPVDRAATNAYVCTMNVDSLDDRIEAVKSAGGTIVVDKMEIPGIGWLVYAKDPEGNIFGMMQPNESSRS